MTDQATRGRERAEGRLTSRKPRDAAHWARNVETLEGAAVPDGASSVNVHGRREVGALQGFGQLWQKTYRVRLAGLEVTPVEAVQIWKERLTEFQPPTSRFYPSMAGLAPGEVLFIGASGGGIPVYKGVRVIYADDESFTVMTPEGHPESGWNTFSAFGDENGMTVAQVQSLAAHFGVNEPVTLEKVCVDPKVQWSEIKNAWHKAGARSMLCTMTGPGRWLHGLMRRRGT